MVFVVKKRNNLGGMIGEGFGKGLTGAMSQAREGAQLDKAFEGVDENTTPVDFLRKIMKLPIRDEMKHEIVSHYASTYKAQQTQKYNKAKAEHNSAKAIDARVNQIPKVFSQQTRALGIADDIQEEDKILPMQDQIKEYVSQGANLLEATNFVINKYRGGKKALEELPSHGFLNSAFGLVGIGATNSSLQEGGKAVQQALQFAEPQEVEAELLKKGWEPDEVAYMMGEQGKKLAQERRSNEEGVPEPYQASMGTRPQSEEEANDQADFMAPDEMPQQITYVPQALPKILAQPTDVAAANQDMVRQLLAMPAETFKALPFDQQAKISKILGQRASDESNFHISRGLTLGVTERARKELQPQKEDLVIGEHAKDAARMVGSLPIYSGVSRLTGRFFSGPGIVNWLLRGGKAGAEFAGVYGVEKLIEEGELPSLKELGQVAIEGALFDRFLVGSFELVGAAGRKIVNGKNAIKKFHKNLKDVGAKEGKTPWEMFKEGMEKVAEGSTTGNDDKKFMLNKENFRKLFNYMERRANRGKAKEPLLLEYNDTPGPIPEDNDVIHGTDKSRPSKERSLEHPDKLFPFERGKRHMPQHETITPEPPHQKLIPSKSPNTSPEPVGFTTAKGSTYEIHEDGTTTRNKKYRPEHGAKEQGPQPKSEITVYAKLEDAYRMGHVQSNLDQYRIVRSEDGKKMAGQFIDGKYKGIIDKHSIIDIKTKPEVGLIPIETWKRGRGIHFGNKITEIKYKPSDVKKIGHTEPAPIGKIPEFEIKEAPGPKDVEEMGYEMKPGDRGNRYHTKLEQERRRRSALAKPSAPKLKIGDYVSGKDFKKGKIIKVTAQYVEVQTPKGVYRRKPSSLKKVK